MKVASQRRLDWQVRTIKVRIMSGLSKQTWAGLRERACPQQRPLSLLTYLSLRVPKHEPTGTLFIGPGRSLCKHFLNPDQSLVTVQPRWEMRRKGPHHSAVRTPSSPSIASCVTSALSPGVLTDTLNSHPVIPECGISMRREKARCQGSAAPGSVTGLPSDGAELPRCSDSSPVRVGTEPTCMVPWESRGRAQQLRGEQP